MPKHFKLWQRHTTKNYSSEMNEIEGLKHLNASRGTLICLPGLRTTHDDPGEINGYMGIAQELLGGREVGTNLISVSYPSTRLEKPHIDQYNRDPLHYSSPGAREFAQSVLIPLLQTGDDVNILAKSYGSVFFKMAMNEVRRQEIAYDPAKLRVLATGSIARLNHELPHQATEIYVEGTQDSKAKRLNRYREPPPGGHDDITLTPLTPSVLHVQADIPEKGLLWNATPTQLQPQSLSDPERHTTRMYTTPLPDHSVAHLLRRVLRNMLTLKGDAFTLESAIQPRQPLSPLRHDIGHNEANFSHYLSLHLEKGLQRGTQSRKVKAVLFDWDLTLADGEEVNLKSLNGTFRAMAEKNYAKPAFEHWDRKTMRKKFVGTVPSFFEDAYGEFGSAVVEQAKEEFRRLRAENRDATVLAPGARELLGELHKNNIKIAIVSNKDKPELQAQIAMLLPEAEFGHIAVVGNEDGIKGKPAPDQLLAALKLLGIKAEDASSVLMVGDLIKTDIDAARKAGCKPCLIGEADRDALFDAARHFLDEGSDHHAVVQHQDGTPILYVQDLAMLGKYLSNPQLNRASGFAL